jgi:hypothetical protein
MNILDGEYQLEADWSRDHNVRPRTTMRYRKEPDGLPWVKFGGRVYIHLPGSREWLKRRTRRPSPTRRKSKA